MTSPVFTLSLVRELRGSPLTVLVAMLLLEQSGQVPVTAQLLKDATGFGDHTIAEALRTLTSPTRQIVGRVQGGWRLAEGFQLPLEITPAIRKNREKCSFPEENREFRGKSLSSSCSSDININLRDSEEEQEESEENREKCSFSVHDPEAFRTNYRLAKALGIRDPKASQLSAMPEVTPKLIQAHVDEAAAEGHPLGTAIYRIMHGWSPRLDEKVQKRIEIEKLAAELTGHKPGCICTDCQMARLGAQICPNCHHCYNNCECEEEDVSTETEDDHAKN